MYESTLSAHKSRIIKILKLLMKGTLDLKNELLGS